ncbi:fatty acyl-AMP ligase [Streptomyces kanamyceticus]|uniref:Fatty acyl-AMP ligase n=1 Tax=Streptomyces kanamyceticus TaxID=1967 RepID=A0A5J6G946_STRKN|nr:fatty acyl-AMP ligase [Streptomyces kanamyceticus]QEU91134.1 fatty acyl-AMP ligase [Streptomyces kanamyceticus]
MTDVRKASSLSQVLRGLARSRPDEAAVIHIRVPDTDDGYDTLTYARLDLAARRLADRLRTELGLRAGDRVLLQYPSGTQFPIAFFGCLYAGLITVPAPLPGRNRRERQRVKGIVRQGGIRAILTDEENHPAVSEWARTESLDDVPLLVTAGEDPASYDEASYDGEASYDDAASLPGEAANPETPALIQYTSGSTSDPKGVVITHGNLLHNVAAMGESFAIAPGTRHGGWIPLYHDMGLIGHLLTGVLLGRGVVTLNPITFVRRPHQWLRAIDRFDIGHSNAPNFAYELCVQRVTDEQIEGLDLSRWRYAINGSEPVHAATLREFTERFAPYGFRADALVPCYGMAEATLYVSGSVLREPVTLVADAEFLEKNVLAPATGAAGAETATRELVSCGDVHDLACRIVDPVSGEALAEGHVGEIWLNGPSVAKGYWDNEAATVETFGATLEGDRYLRTGDLGALLDGELFITGRMKETLMINGRNLYPQDVEHELRSHHTELATLPGAAFTVVEERGGRHEEVLVVAQEVTGQLPEEEYARLAAEMKQTVSREFGLPVRGVALLRRGGVRRTTSGKIQRVAMRELYLADALQPLYADWQD